ncbi:MAG: ATP-binding cassette domain-containing protein [Bacteroidota bacterium]
MKRLEIDSVTKSFGSTRILRDIFLQVEAGEIVGLMGRNGSGKSTLLKIVFGSLQASNAFIRADSRHMFSQADRYRWLTYLPQETFLPRHMTIREVLTLFCSREAVRYLAQSELIAPHISFKARQLSLGTLRTIEVLLLIYSQAQYTLLDEPFHSLAPLVKEEVRFHISRQTQHKGFLLTDHDYRNLLEVSDRIILLDQGKTFPIQGKQELVDRGYLSAQSLS